MTLAIGTQRSTAAKRLFGSIVDYAGLFPPAALSLEDVVAEYARQRRGANEWLLGCLVVPLDRLNEVEKARGGLDADDAPWPVSVLISGAPGEVARLQTVAEGLRATTVGALEVAPLTALEIERFADEAPADTTVFFELDCGEGLEERLDAVASAGRCAKIRTGGMEVGAFPGPEVVARFLCACGNRRVPFKATAGLHHALRGIYPVTYEPDSVTTRMHGLLNVVLAAAVAYCDEADESEIVALLGEEAASAFEADRKWIRWRDRSWTLSEIGRMRRRFFLSVGSCSFEEPLAELEHIGWTE